MNTARLGLPLRRFESLPPPFDPLTQLLTSPPAGGGAYYFAKREINADRKAKLEAHRRKRSDIRAMEYGGPSQPMAPSSSSAAAASGADTAGSPSAESSNDPSPAGQEGLAAPKRDKEDVSPYESKVGYTSRKGDRFS
ncbi:hypothetical protein CCM_07891 [Cordyceps militaris CM01]|uniref:Uncharacterized protein n=1 Tax=Cordyceps militaris (strain CM01) TaxID=983644 RepID=G3JP29_CORMM|nr:uncharacterized protein CCM_07891 [Cordyceps militaris CM01]EGX89639.1 hypothetical protein CCM_07891 [Cordyceps militaris CM01]